MAEPIKIEIFKKKDAEAFSKSFADPESRMDSGSGLAMCASLAVGLFCRGAKLTAAGKEGDEKLEYLLRNGETLRKYMVHLIDEDVRCHGPLRKAMKDGDPQKIDAAREPAASITNEIINMMTKLFELLEGLAELCTPEAAACAAESAELAMGVMRSGMRHVVYMGSLSADPTYRFVTKRENEITLEQFSESYRRILEKTVLS